MNPVLQEYLLKGLYLGLWVYLALVHPRWEVVGRVVAWTIAGLAVGLFAGTARQLARGYRPGRNLGGFLLLILLDNPYLIYLGLLGGLGIGLVVETDPRNLEQAEALLAIVGGLSASGTAAAVGSNWLAYCAIAGCVMGYGFFQLRQVKDGLWRFGLGAVVGAILVTLALSYLDDLPDFVDALAQERLGQILLVGIPFFYLLTFCGEAEESEIEIAAICAQFGLGLYLCHYFQKMPAIGTKVVFLVPLTLYFVYVTRWLPGLRVFKHTLRGYGSLSLGRVRDSLASFGRALQLDPKNELAGRGLYELHRRVDVSSLDPSTMRLLNFEFCLMLAEKYLVGERPPTSSELTEAVRLLDLTQENRPDLQPRVDYLKAVALTHAREFDRAAGYLARLLDPTTSVPNPMLRNRYLLQGWDLALRLHPEMIARLGAEELAKPGRRIDAIAAVERKLADDPTDTTASEIRATLYSTLTEAEFLAASGVSSADFNFDHVEQLGLSLISDAEPERIERGMAYLRIAGRGLPLRGAGIFANLAKLADQRNQPEEARGYREQVKRAGLIVGPAKLAADQRSIYLETLKELVADATRRNDYDSAVGDQRLWIEAGQEDVASLRQLAELHALAGDLLNAILIVERGLLYSRTDPDLLQKKDSYYFSVDVERVRAVREKVAPWFDVAYCVKQARKVADHKEPDLEMLEWGLHLATLARIVQPTLHSVMLAEARLLLRLGRRDPGLSLLEDIREQPRGSGEEEDAWFQAVRFLADIYLNELSRPDLAIPCYNAYREYQKSGADTQYHLGRAYEAIGDVPNALRSYEVVTAYTQHPRYHDAQEAIRRLKGVG